MGADKVRAALEALGPDVDALRAGARVPRPEPRTVEFWIPTLGGRDLSSNGNRRHGLAVAAAKDALGTAAYHACLNVLGPLVPALTPPVDIYLEFHIKHHAKARDGLYRFEDPSNGGGEVAKPIVDAGIVKTGIIPDDDYKHVRFFTCHVVNVAELSAEGIHVRVTETTTD